MITHACNSSSVKYIQSILWIELAVQSGDVIEETHRVFFLDIKFKFNTSRIGSCNTDLSRG